MKAYILRKIILHGCVSAAVCVLLGLFSRGGRLYAGFGAAFLGAAYLLAAWLRWLSCSISRMAASMPLISILGTLRPPFRPPAGLSGAYSPLCSPGG